MDAPVIYVENLIITSREKVILDLEALAVRRGEILTVIGPNGAGKSTFLRACLGLIPFSRGQIRVLDQSVGRLNRYAMNRIRRRIGYVPQELASRSEMPITVREVVAIGRTGLAGLFRPLKRKDWHEIETWIDRLGLSNLSDRAYGELSGGEQQRTLLARAMVQEPEILMLDEPTAHLDLSNREQMVKILENLYSQTNITILLICHELEVIPPCCRRLAILDHGRLVDAGPLESVLTTERIRHLYGQGLTVLHRAGRHIVIPDSPSKSRSDTY